MIPRFALPTAAAVLALAACGEAPVTATAEVAAPRLGATASTVTAAPGYEVDRVAGGLHGPQQLLSLGGGLLLVTETNPPPSRLTFVQPGGGTRVLAAISGGPITGVVLDPSRGFFASSNPSVQGVLQVRRNGDASVFGTTPPLVFAAAIALGHDGTLYVQEVRGVPGTLISAFDAAGQRTVFKPAIRSDDIDVDDDGSLVATIAFRTFGGPLPFPPLDNQLLRIDTATGAETVIATVGGGRVGYLAIERGGDYYVSDWVDGKVRRVARDGSAVEVVVEGLSTGFQDLTTGASSFSFNGVAVDEAGRVYVSDYRTGEIYRVRRTH